MVEDRTGKNTGNAGGVGAVSAVQRIQRCTDRVLPAGTGVKSMMSTGNSRTKL